MNKYPLGLMAIIVCISTTLWGSTAPVAARTVLDNQYNQQQQQWGADQSSRQLERHEKLDALRVEWPTQSHRMAVSTGPAVSIQKISIRGATVMGRKEQRRLVRAFEGTDMDMQAMEALVHRINTWYMSRGYITSLAYIAPGQSMASGALVIDVEEGRIQAVVSETGETPVAFTLAFPFVGKVLNIRDLEQGLDQVNRLGQNRMVLDLEPASIGYGTVVRIINQHPAPKPQLNQAIITYLHQTDGRVNAFPSQVTVLSDNFLFINDQWAMTYSQSAMTQDNQSSSLFSSVTVPVGYWLMGYTYSLFVYQQLIPQGPYAYASAYGHTEQNTVSLTRTVFRNQVSKTYVEAALSASNQIQMLNKTQLGVGSHKKTVGKLGVSHHWYARVSGSVSVAQHRGLPWWDATPDLANRTTDEPVFMFDKTTVTAQLNTHLSVPGFTAPITYRMTSLHQWSPHTLWASDRMALGGRYSVRGFDGSLSGDYGYYAQHEWRLPLHRSFVLPDASASLFLGLDHGTVLSQTGASPDGNSGEGTLVGATLGVDYQWRDITLSVMLSKPLQWSTPTPPSNETVYASLRLDWF